MLPPRPELQVHLQRAHPGATIVPIVGDASTRRFFRMTGNDGSSFIVMDYGAPFSGETDDVRLTRVFASASLPVPAILEISPSPGCLVLEDLGDATLESVLTSPSGSPELRERLYRRGVELCVAIASQGSRALAASDRASGPSLDAARFRFEMQFFLDHYAEGVAGLRTVSDPLRRGLLDLADRAASGPRVLCHRDFHSRNLLVVREGLAMVDIQDARWGPDTYDLASLLRDAYVEIDEDRVEAMLGLFAASIPAGTDASSLRSRFEVVAIQRMIKALGTFGYQVAILGRGRYLSGIARTLRRLRAILPGTEGLGGLTKELDRAGLLEPPSGLQAETLDDQGG